MPALPPDNLIVETIILVKANTAENEKMCSKQGQFCLEMVNQDGKNTLFVTITKSGLADEKIEVAVGDSENAGFGGTALHIYPKLYLVLDGDTKKIKSALFGTLTHSSDMYSGGGASGDVLNLYYSEPFKAGEGAKSVLDLPIYGYKMIRACFSEEEYKARSYACHDEYRFDANFKPTKTLVNQLPVFEYSSSAANFPVGVSLDADNSGRKLRKKDFVWQNDPDCTIKNKFHFDEQKKTYIPQKALPECGDYFPGN